MKKTIIYMGCDIPDGNAAAIRVTANALALKEYGYNVIIISFDHFYSEEITYYHGMTVIHFQYPNTSKLFAKYLFSIDIYRKVIEKYKHNNVTAVITYDQPAISFLRLKKVVHKNSIALICDCAEWHTAVHLKGIKKLIKALDIMLSMRYAYKKCDGLIAISHFLEDYYKPYIKTIRVPPLQYTKQEKQENVVNSSAKSFIYAGIPGKDKDRLDLIVGAFVDIKSDYVFNIYGIDLNSFIKMYPGIRDSLIVGESASRIRFHGKVPHDEVIEATKKSDFTLIIRESSRKNNAGFPSKFTESICCGTPVIATDISDLKKYINKYKLGIAADIDNLSMALYEAIRLKPTEINELRRNCFECREFVYHNYTNKLGKFIEQTTRENED